jgi:hypothetical protein
MNFEMQNPDILLSSSYLSGFVVEHTVQHLITVDGISLRLDPGGRCVSPAPAEGGEGGLSNWADRAAKRHYLITNPEQEQWVRGTPAAKAEGFPCTFLSLGFENSGVPLSHISIISSSNN